MSARGGRWELLDRDTDPVPGEESVVQRLANIYAETGQAIDESASKLERLAALDGWTGKAAEKFAEAAEDVADDLAKAERRYTDAGAALDRFVTPVREARDESWSALSDAIEADEDMSRSAGDNLEGVEKPTPEQVDAQRQRSQNHDEAAGRLTAAKNRLSNALAALATAAGTCGEAIRAAAEHNNDGRWDNIKGGLRDFADWAHLDVVVKVLTVIAVAIAVVAIAVAMIVTAPLWIGTALFVAGMVIGGLALAANLTLAVSQHPAGSWTNVALDVFGLATLGASRALTSGARATVAADRATMSTAASGSARNAEAARIAATTQARSQVPNGLKTTPDNPLHIWAQSKQGQWAAQTARAGDDAATAVTSPAMRDVAAEIRRLQALPHPSPAVTQSLEEALRQVRTGTIAGNAGDVGNAVNATDLAYPVVDRFDEYVAIVEWRMSR